MAKLFKAAEKHVRDIFDTAAKKWHPEVAGSDLRIAFVMVEANKDDDGNATSPAVRNEGYASLAKISKVPADKKPHLKAEAIVHIDLDWWGDIKNPQRLAAADDILARIEFKHGEEDKIVTDDEGKPWFRLKKPDVRVSGFREVMTRQGDHSIAAEDLKALFDEKGQCLFPFALAS